MHPHARHEGFPMEWPCDFCIGCHTKSQQEGLPDKQYGKVHVSCCKDCMARRVQLHTGSSLKGLVYNDSMLAHASTFFCTGACCHAMVTHWPASHPICSQNDVRTHNMFWEQKSFLQHQQCPMSMLFQHAQCHPFQSNSLPQ